MSTWVIFFHVCGVVWTDIEVWFCHQLVSKMFQMAIDDRSGLKMNLKYKFECCRVVRRYRCTSMVLEDYNALNINCLLTATAAVAPTTTYRLFFFLDATPYRWTELLYGYYIYRNMKFQLVLGHCRLAISRIRCKKNYCSRRIFQSVEIIQILFVEIKIKM